MTLRTVLLSLQALLAAAEPDDPQDAVVAKQYKEDHEMFKLTARHWTQAYAGGCIFFPFFFIFHTPRKMGYCICSNCKASTLHLI